MRLSFAFSRSVRFRITLLFVTIFAATLVGFSAFLYRNLVNTQQAEFDRALFNLAIDVTQGIELDLFGDLAVKRDSLLEQGKILPFSLGKALLQITRPDGHVLVRSRSLGSAHLPLSREDLWLLASGGSGVRTLSARQIFEGAAHGAVPYRLLTKTVNRFPLGTLTFQIAAPMNFLEAQRRELLAFLFVSIPLLLLVAAVGGWYTSTRALAPVKVIIERTRKLGANRLSERIPVPAVHDEMRLLTLTLNGLLARLEQAFVSQERFVADASHQLKTPLAILRGELDVLLKGEMRREWVDQFLQSASQEINYLSRLVEDLLVLARVDAGTGSLVTSSVRLDELLLETVARFEVFAREREVRLRFNVLPSDDADFTVEMDPDLAKSLFQSLLENAVKYSPRGGRVSIEVARREQRLELSVSDEGPGIPVAVREKIFERFFRIDEPQSAHDGSKVPGLGLGLAIARRIAEVHGAELRVEDAQPLTSGAQVGAGPGTRFTLTFPAGALS